MTGRTTVAEQALREFQDVSDSVNSDVTADTSMIGWSPSRAAFGKSFAYSHLGDYQRAAQAQDDAIALSTASSPLHNTKIELMRALCLAKTGAGTEASTYALEVLEVVPEAQHDLPAARLGEMILRALPATRRGHDATNELARYVTTRKAIHA